MTRGAIERIVLGLWLACFTAAAAQLPPEVLVDKYLLQAQMLSEEKDHKGALEAMDRIVALQEEHYLTLPEEFSYRYAQTALAAGSVPAAIDAANRYLSAAGREGKYYREALELLVKAERGLDEPAADSSGSSPVEQDLEPQSQAVLPSPPQAQKTAEAQPILGCWRWNTATYFRRASVKPVTACLKAGADPNARDKSERTPLHYAARFNENPAVVEVLLKAGADPNARDKWESTPLHEAASSNENPEVIEALLKSGAAPNARDEGGETPLHDAASFNENPAVIEVLLTASPESRADLQWTPVHEAVVINQDVGVIEALLKAGSYPDARDKSERTPLHYGARFNENPAVVEVLLKAGADPKARDKWESTPLHEAASSNENPEVIETLLKAGADLKARTKRKITPLHRAAGNNENPEVIETLLKAGADLKARDEFKETPLHRAARWNENPSVIEVLLQAGADPTARVKGKRTPLHVAARNNKNPSVVEVLLKAGADVEARGEDKRTPLHDAARYNENPAVIGVLLQAGANLAALDRDGRTPFALAKKHNENQAVQQALLAAGAGRVEQQRTAEKARSKSQSGGSGWAALVAGVTGAAIGAAGGLDAATATEIGATIGGSVLTGEAAGNTEGDYPSAPSVRGGSSSEFDTALRSLEDRCGERYRSAFSDQDHGRFYCLDAFARHCALKNGPNQQQLDALRHDFEVLRSQGLQSRCPYFGILGGTYNENQTIPKVPEPVTEEKPTAPVTPKRRLPTCAGGQEVPKTVAEGKKPGCPPESWCRWYACRSDECRRRYRKCEPGVLPTSR